MTTAAYVYTTPDARDSIPALLYKIAIAGGVSSGLLAAPQESANVPNFVAVGTNASGDIPANVKRWLFVLRSGNGTLGGVPVPQDIAISGSNPAAPIHFTTGAGGSAAFIFWEA